MLPLYTHNTPPQVGEYISYNPSLLHNKRKQVLHKALENISAIWPLIETYYCNMTIYYYMLILLMEHKIGRNVNCRLIITMHRHRHLTTNFNSSSNCLIHISSHDMCAMAPYSASTLDLEITVCFLLFRTIK